MKVLKKIAIVFGVIFGLLIVTAIVVPFFIDVDKYRPQVVEMANEKINGKLELGKLSLSLWGQVKVQVDGMTLSDLQGKKIVSVKDVFFHLPFTSILSGSPQLTLKMQSPEVFVVKDKKGKLNVLSLMKPQTAATSAPAEPAKPTTTGGKSLPALATNARVGFEMRGALLSYIDQLTALTSEVKDLNVVARDLSLSRPTELEVWADLDTKMGKTLTLKGPARLTATASPKFQGSELLQADVSVKASLDKIQISMPGLFEKGPNVPANADGKLKLVGQKLTIEKFTVRFHNAEVDVTGTVDLDGTPGVAPELASPVVQLNVRSNPIALKPWSELVPMLKAYELGGTATLVADANGAVSDLKYKAQLGVDKLTAKAPMIKAQPTVDGVVKIVTDQIESMSFKMRAPGNDLSITGRLVSFKAPKIDVNVTSTGMDLDQLIDFPKPAPKAAPTASKAPESKPGPKGDGGPASDLDASLDPLRKNPMMSAIVANIRFQLNSLKAYQVKMSNVNGQMSFKNLAFGIDSFKMGVFGGTIGSTANVQMMPRVPTYRFHAEVAALDLKEAVSSQLELFKNTLTGKASFKIDGSGSSFNPDPAKQHLNARGNFSVAQASFASLDIGKMAADAIGKALQGLGDKVPALKNTKLGAPGNIESKYALVASDFTIENGVFSAPNFTGKAGPNRGLDLSGNTRVGLKEYGLQTEWEIIDTYNLTKARDLTVDHAGVRVEHILADGNNPVRFPVKVGGTCFAPAPNYTSVPEALGKVALANVGKAAEARVKAEAGEKAQEQVNKLSEKAPPALQNAIKGFGKKLFGN